MRGHIILRVAVALVLMVVAFAVAGCSRHASDGPYAEVKQGWDSQRSFDQLSSMRTRLQTTQQDH